MTNFQAYLNRPKTKKVLSTKPGEEGFSLIELVVVVAVLAILAAIAIPAFVNINDQAKASAAANTLAQVAKECAIKSAQDTGTTFNTVNLNGYSINTTNCSGNANDEITFTGSPDTKLPTFTYDVVTGEKSCTHKHKSLTALHGCSAKTSGVW